MNNETLSNINNFLNSFSKASIGKRAKKNLFNTALKKGLIEGATNAARMLIKCICTAAESCIGTQYSLGNIDGDVVREIISIMDIESVDIVGDSKACAKITFPKDGERYSMVSQEFPIQYDPINSIVELLNNGYIAGSSVFGEWPIGRFGYSLRVREGANFIEKGIRSFLDIYGYEFGISSGDNSIYVNFKSGNVEFF